jgi:hypothetical protein
MNYWKLKVYISQRGSDVIDEWLESLPVDARARIRTHFAFLVTLKDWRRPYAAKLRGKTYDTIWEIRISWNKIQYRPLGCFGPEADYFTLLIGAIERSTGIFEPRNAPEIAKERCIQINNDRRYICDYKEEFNR